MPDKTKFSRPSKHRSMFRSGAKLSRSLISDMRGNTPTETRAAMPPIQVRHTGGMPRMDMRTPSQRVNPGVRRSGTAAPQRVERVKPIRIVRKAPVVRGGGLPSNPASILRGLGNLVRMNPNLRGVSAAESAGVAKRAMNSYNQGRAKAGQRPIDFPGRRRLPKTSRVGARKH